MGAVGAIGVTRPLRVDRVRGMVANFFGKDGSVRLCGTKMELDGGCNRAMGSQKNSLCVFDRETSDLSYCYDVVEGCITCQLFCKYCISRGVRWGYGQCSCDRIVRFSSYERRNSGVMGMRGLLLRGWYWECGRKAKPCGSGVAIERVNCT